MSGLGNQLREARERMRVTVTEAAAATHLKMLVIDAMERDDYPKLIAPTYAKGFYRLYCEYLGLDAEPFVEAYLQAAGVSDDKAELIRDPKKKPGLFSGLQKKMKEMQDRKEVQRKAKEIADAREKAQQMARRGGRVGSRNGRRRGAGGVADRAAAAESRRRAAGAAAGRARGAASVPGCPAGQPAAAWPSRRQPEPRQSRSRESCRSRKSEEAEEVQAVVPPPKPAEEPSARSPSPGARARRSRR